MIGLAERRHRPSQRGEGRAVILAAAVDNFGRLGFHGTSMRDIARDADLTVASIYHHFPSKQLILHDIMVAALSDAIALTRGALMRAGTTPAEQLTAIMRAWIQFHTSHQADALIGVSEIRSLDEVGLRLVVALRDEQERMFRDVVERGVADGVFDTPYPHEAVRALLNMGSSVSTWYRRGGDLTPDDLADRYCALALSLVGGSPDGDATGSG